MAVSVQYLGQLKVTETLDINVPAIDSSSNAQVVHNGFTTNETKNATSTPPVTKMSAFTQALAAGAATIDLTDLVGTNGAEVDGTGLRVQYFKMINNGANVMTLSVGASNGYDAWGADFSIEIDPGAEIILKTNDGGSDIGSTNCELDIAGTLIQEADVMILMG